MKQKSTTPPRAYALSESDVCPPYPMTPAEHAAERRKQRTRRPARRIRPPPQ